MRQAKTATSVAWRYVAFAFILLPCTSCGTSSPLLAPPTHAGASGDPKRARGLALEALGVLESDPTKAEKLLQSALKADPFDGPAHNNLGVLFLRQSKLYEAASEFEQARKLMPGNPDPRLNLGLTFEKAGLYERAFNAYDAALEASPTHIRTTQAIARLTLRTGRTNARLSGMLEEIALRGETSIWRSWAKEQLSRLKH
jgi:tetratricopeptide (TPR) repeat protein